MESLGRNIGPRIAKLLAARDMTQEELAHRIGLSQSAMSKLVSGSRINPPFLTVWAIAQVFGITIEELVGAHPAQGTSFIVDSNVLAGLLPAQTLERSLSALEQGEPNALATLQVQLARSIPVMQAIVEHLERNASKKETDGHVAAPSDSRAQKRLVK